MSHATHKGTRTFTRLNFAIPYQQFITVIHYANNQGESQRRQGEWRGFEGEGGGEDIIIDINITI